MKKNIFEIIELILDDLDLESGVDAVSYVNSPAIQADFIHFHKEYNTSFSSIDEEKRIVVGPALVPDKMILRKQKEDFFYVYFSAETIRKTAHKFLTNGHQGNTTFEHSAKLSDVSIVESWIIEDKVHDKSVSLGFDLPVGTWMLTSKIDDDATWESIKSGEVKGYSIEGVFVDKTLLSREEDIQTEIDEFEAEMELIGTDEEKAQYAEIKSLIDSIFEDEETE
jgi:hypothetical protein